MKAKGKRLRQREVLEYTLKADFAKDRFELQGDAAKMVRLIDALITLLVAGFQPGPAWWNVNGPSKMWSCHVDAAIE
jgi:hypothetical protein